MNPADADFIHVVVVDHDPAWAAAFDREAGLIRDILKDNLIGIFHIGSTSVPGLKAKPIIDMLPVVHDIARLDRCTDRFEAAGYEAMGEFGLAGRRYFRKGGKNRTHQIHAYQYDSIHSILRHLAFRDYLRCHPDACAAYGDLKAALAARFPCDIEKYCDGKDAFVKRMECDAIKWYWATRGAARRPDSPPDLPV